MTDQAPNLKYNLFDFLYYPVELVPLSPTADACLRSRPKTAR